MNVKRLAKPSIMLIMSLHVRNIGLSLAITHGNSSILFQLLFLNFSSLFILGIMGTLRPYQSRGTHWLEMANEFVVRILLLNLLMCQTDFVRDLQARSILAWVFIGIIILMIVLNMGVVIFESVKSLKLYGKRVVMKCKARKRR